jgi:polyhydroxybutyrate depolymerase
MAWQIKEGMRKTRLLRAVFLFLLLSLPALCIPRLAAAENDLPANPKPGDYKRSLPFGGRERSYVLHIPPSYTGRKLFPLIIVLHGGGGNARSAMRMTGMSDTADEEGFIAVFPQGSGRLTDHLLTWNAGNCCGYALDQKIDDVGFIRTLIEELQKEFNIDDKRIYVTGMSNGAKMVYKLGCELSNKIAAIAPVAGSLDIENCQPRHPLSVIIFHGTADEHVLYEGGEPRKQADRYQRVDKPVSYAVSFWVNYNQCSTKPKLQERSNIIRETYANCKDSTEVVLYTIKGGGHAWPGGKKGTPWGDKPTQEISATDEMLDFFVRHPKR